MPPKRGGARRAPAKPSVKSSAHSSPAADMPDCTPPSSPPAAENPLVSEAMQNEEKRMASASAKEDAAREARLAEERRADRQGGEEAVSGKFKALEYLLSQSKLYSTIMLAQMQKQEEQDEKRDEGARRRAKKREEDAEHAAQGAQRRSGRRGGGDGELVVQEEADEKAKKEKGTPTKKKKKSGKISDYLKKEDVEKVGQGASVQDALRQEVHPGDVGVQNLQSARQPELVTGGTMRQYQLEGLEWLVSLYENGLNGILADEMGLGKTIQVISFLAFLRSKGVMGPFLIAAPLSTTGNWINEFRKWTPDIPAVLYHGSKDEREQIRNTRLKKPGSKEFPVICTSYEICMNDRKFLAHYGWKFIIIDEGHRIKNLNCKLIRELQSYQSANRLLITGTPLQNNLSELWSLLHFLMPEIFDKLESFESWFDFSALKEKNGYQQILSEERRRSLVTSLHAILKPFLLRRVKTDVEHSLPKKREYVLYAPLMQEQRDLYQAILDGTSRSYLEDRVFESLSRNASGASTPNGAASKSGTKRKSNGAQTPLSKSAKTSRDSTPGSTNTRTRRARPSQNYEELSDTKYFKKLEGEDEEEEGESTASVEDAHINTHAATLALAKKHIAQKKLQNPVLQLRLVCNTVDLFFDRFALADDTDKAIPAPDYTALVTSSGKMQILDRLLKVLLSDHKVLIFSQFKTQLDLLAVYLEEVLGQHACRIDGSIPAAERQEQIDLFNDDPEYRVFLLSTRAGGQGINLAAADTIVLFDSDWNPQQDLQAQDRAHRIGQRRNVIVYRLATRGTVEEVLLEKAESKRRLEKLVIQRGKFRGWREPGKGRDEADDGLDELRGLLGQTDGELLDLQGRELLSDDEVKVLTDRSDEAYLRAERGEDTGAMFKAVESKAGEGLLGSLSK